jgi:MFS family permease
MATILLVPIIGVATYGISLLIVGMIGLGFGMGMVDVSMNAHATTYEMLTGTHSMGLFHANYALGSFLGAIVGGIFARAEVSPLKNFVLVSLIAIVPSIGLYFWLLGKEDEAAVMKAFQGSSGGATSHSDYTSVNTTDNDEQLDQASEMEAAKSKTSDEDAASKESYFNIHSHKFQLTLLCAIAFASSLGEGSINDWSTIYFVETLGSSQFLAAIGFACFEVMVALGRLYSDYLLAKYDGKVLLRVAGCLACAGLLLVVMSRYFGNGGGEVGMSVIVSMIGFAICGSGISICSPIVMHLASRVPGVAPSDAITNLTTFIYMAMLIGPPTIGGLSAAFGGLQWALLVDAIFLLVIFLGACGMRSSTRSTSTSRLLDGAEGSMEKRLLQGDSESAAAVGSPLHTASMT